MLDALMKMNPKKFELFCRGLLTKMGIDVDDKIGVRYVADGGLDGFGYVRSNDYRTTRVALQAKRWQGKVSSPEIDKFRGAWTNIMRNLAFLLLILILRVML